MTFIRYPEESKLFKLSGVASFNSLKSLTKTSFFLFKQNAFVSQDYNLETEYSLLPCPMNFIFNHGLEIFALTLNCIVILFQIKLSKEFISLPIYLLESIHVTLSLSLSVLFFIFFNNIFWVLCENLYLIYLKEFLLLIIPSVFLYTENNILILILLYT